MENILTKDEFLYANKSIIQACGLYTSILFSQLCELYNYYESNNLLDAYGMFSYTKQECFEEIGLSPYQQDQAFKELEIYDIVYTINKEIPRKRYIKINKDEIDIFIECCEIKCKAKNEKDKELKQYYKIVNDLTKQNYKKYKNIINPNNIVRNDEYHLDHIYSKNLGYKNNIDPKIIASPINLRVISMRENISKGNRCDISEDELIKKYNNFMLRED